MGSKLEISPYLFNHHYGFQQPYSLSEKWVAVEAMDVRGARELTSEMGLLWGCDSG